MTQAATATALDPTQLDEARRYRQRGGHRADLVDYLRRCGSAPADAEKLADRFDLEIGMAGEARPHDINPAVAKQLDAHWALLAATAEVPATSPSSPALTAQDAPSPSPRSLSAAEIARSAMERHANGTADVDVVAPVRDLALTKPISETETQPNVEPAPTAPEQPAAQAHPAQPLPAQALAPEPHAMPTPPAPAAAAPVQPAAPAEPQALAPQPQAMPAPPAPTAPIAPEQTPAEPQALAPEPQAMPAPPAPTAPIAPEQTPAEPQALAPEPQALATQPQAMPAPPAPTAPIAPEQTPAEPQALAPEPQALATQPQAMPAPPAPTAPIAPEQTPAAPTQPPTPAEPQALAPEPQAMPAPPAPTAPAPEAPLAQPLLAPTAATPPAQPSIAPAATTPPAQPAIAPAASQPVQAAPPAPATPAPAPAEAPAPAPVSPAPPQALQQEPVQQQAAPQQAAPQPAVPQEATAQPAEAMQPALPPTLAETQAAYAAQHDVATTATVEQPVVAAAPATSVTDEGRPLERSTSLVAAMAKRTVTPEPAGGPANEPAQPDTDEVAGQHLVDTTRSTKNAGPQVDADWQETTEFGYRIAKSWDEDDPNVAINEANEMAAKGKTREDIIEYLISCQVSPEEAAYVAGMTGARRRPKPVEDDSDQPTRAKGRGRAFALVAMMLIAGGLMIYIGWSAYTEGAESSRSPLSLVAIGAAIALNGVRSGLSLRR